MFTFTDTPPGTVGDPSTSTSKELFTDTTAGADVGEPTVTSKEPKATFQMSLHLAEEVDIAPSPLDSSNSSLDDLFEHSSDDYVPSEDSDTSVPEDELPDNQPAVVRPRLNFTDNLNVGLHKNKRGGRKEVEGKVTRKRLRKPDSWNRNIRKKCQNEGLEYKTAKNKVVEAKLFKKPCNCRTKCFEKLSVIGRAMIFADFYSLSKQGKDQFISSSVEEIRKKPEKLRKNDGKEKRRKFTRKYYLPNQTEPLEVCQTMFLNTLDYTLKKV